MSNSQVQDENLSVREAAEYLKIKVSTLYGWVHERRIPFRKHGTRLVFSKRRLAEWSEAQEVLPC